MFSVDGDWLIPMNTSFLLDTEKHGGLTSIERKVQERYYSECVDAIQNDILNQVNRNKRKECGHVCGKEVALHSYGATAKIELNKDRTLYMVAMKDISDESTEMKSKAMDALDRFWIEMNKKEYTCRTLVIPMVGTGKSGYCTNIDEVAMGIIDSYINYLQTGEKYVTNNLVISIHPDYSDAVDMTTLKEYLKYRCNFGLMK